MLAPHGPYPCSLFYAPTEALDKIPRSGVHSGICAPEDQISVSPAV